MLKAYLKRIYDVSSHGDAREESFYPVLAELFNAYAESTDKKSIQITVHEKCTPAYVDGQNDLDA